MTEDDSVALAFQEAQLDPDAFAYLPKPGPPSSLRTHVGEDSVLTVAIDADGRRQNLLELAGRTWAGQHGIDCPMVLGSSSTGLWLHARRVDAERAEGSAYVHAALDVADRIAASEPPQLSVPASQWRASRKSRVLSALRGIGGGLDVAHFLRFRRAAAALTDLTTCHGDFYRRNVLFRDSRVSVVDWEFVGQAARWTDHLRIWSTLRRAADRAEAWDRITFDLTPGRTEHVHTLVQWLGHRLLAENLAAPPAERDPDDLAHARQVVLEVRRLTAAPR